MSSTVYTAFLSMINIIMNMLFCIELGSYEGVAG